MPEIVNHQNLIDSFVGLMPSRAAPVAKVVSTGAGVASGDLVQKLLVKAQAEPLWGGFWDYEDKIFGRPYQSESEADYALLGAIVRYAEQMGIAQNMVEDAAIRVFERSGLYKDE